MDNKKYIKEVQKILSEKLTYSIRDMDKFTYYKTLYEQLIKERIDIFGDSPDFSTMNIRKKIYPGFYFYVLLMADMITTHRWEYWGDILVTKDFSKDIPQINFDSYRCDRYRSVESMLRNCIDSGHEGASENFMNFIRYLVYSLIPIDHLPGDNKAKKIAKANKLIERIDDKTLKFYYENFSLETMLLEPADYLGDLAAEYLGSNGSAYFPTPSCIVDFMTKIVMSDNKNAKFSKVCDPCCGSSRMLLYASNYSLRLYGNDISGNIVKVSVVNGYLYVPWYVYMTKDIGEKMGYVYKEDLYVEDR